MSYGYCPICGAECIARERRLFGNDKCANGHTYPSNRAHEFPRAPGREDGKRVLGAIYAMRTSFRRAHMNSPTVIRAWIIGAWRRANAPARSWLESRGLCDGAPS